MTCELQKVIIIIGVGVSDRKKCMNVTIYNTEKNKTSHMELFYRHEQNNTTRR